MIPQATVLALRDRRLKRRDLIVYSVALQSLSYYEPRPFKVHVVARVCQVSTGDASRSIRRLTSYGYLERGPNDGPRRTYLVRSAA